TRNLCGEEVCPQVSYWNTIQKLKTIESYFIEAPSPPSVFVGRIGYPRVRVAPAVVPEGSNVEIYDMPEKWLNINLNEILQMRLSLLRACINVDVAKPEKMEDVKILAASSKPVDLEKLRILGNPKIPKPIDRVLLDRELTATEAVMNLYSNSIPVSHIQKLFSIGVFGKAGFRKIVPTRWSITAVDSIISKRLIEKVKKLPVFDSYLFFERRHENNTFIAIIAPYRWSYEWIEAWFPYTTWNPGMRIEVEDDWEDFRGRSTYASLGGCYYAARLATAEYMIREGRQGTAILIREIYEGFFLPIGVWFVRENVREMFKNKPEKFGDIREVLERLSSSTRIQLSRWIKTSRLLTQILLQSRLEVPRL
ncbi:MAG: hypothetical protein QXP74_06215, partial [Nitrososphaerota archaeon]